MEQFDKTEALREVADAKNSVFVFAMDDDGFVTTCFTSKDGFTPAQPEKDVQSQMYALCVELHKEILNWQSRKLAEKE